MRKEENFYFLFGLVIFYFLSLFSPNKILYFCVYFLVTFFFYLSIKILKKSLLFSLILSLFSDFGLAKSLFMLEAQNLDLGPGYSLSPMTVFLFCLLPFSLFEKSKQFHKIDLVVFLFFISSLFSFFIFPYPNVFLGVISLGEIILIYFILRIHLNKDDFKNLSILLISLLVFQTLLGIIQFLFGHPLGKITEGIIINNPYGLVTSEDEYLFRVTGTFNHPNFLASFILISYPFLLIFPASNIYLQVFKLLVLIVLFFTYSRAAWVISLVIFIFFIFKQQVNIKQFRIVNFYSLGFFSLFFIFILIFLTPYLTARLRSFPLAFENFGSMDVRFKTYQEAINLLTQFPLTGVGLFRSIEEYKANPITDLFEKMPVGRFYGIHNTLLEMMTELGIPSGLLFLLFIFLVLRHYFTKEKSYIKNAAYFGLLGLIGISMFNPFFHCSQFRIFFLLSAMILV